MACVRMVSKLTGVDNGIMESILSLPADSAKNVLTKIALEFSRMAGSTQNGGNPVSIPERFINQKDDVLNITKPSVPMLTMDNSSELIKSFDRLLLNDGGKAE